VLKNSPAEIDFISSHGTATPYNDEMESIAITRTGLQNVPVNSFKGYWGHTLGAAGVIESVMGIYSIRNGILFNTKGFSEPGVSNPLNIIRRTERMEVRSCLKIASGFGGCNAAILFQKK
jgi:3-oxoacyl-[acyl-carrier-protein] synthase-1